MESNDSVGWSHSTHQSSSLVLVVVELLNLKEPIYIMKFYTSSPDFRTQYQPYGNHIAIISEVFISQFSSLCFEEMNN